MKLAQAWRNGATRMLTEESRRGSYRAMDAMGPWQDCGIRTRAQLLLPVCLFVRFDSRYLPRPWRMLSRFVRNSAVGLPTVLKYNYARQLCTKAKKKKSIVGIVLKTTAAVAVTSSLAGFYIYSTDEGIRRSMQCGCVYIFFEIHIFVTLF